jgi:hypothetical protein
MDDLFERTPDGWEDAGGGSGGGPAWSNIDDVEDEGVLRYGDEAPDGVTAALVEFGNDLHRAPVRHGHFLFVAWNVPSAVLEDPRLVGFE